MNGLLFLCAKIDALNKTVGRLIAWLILAMVLLSVFTAIARKFGLASIELFTAGGSSSDLEIPGLLLEEAQQIKNMVSQKINPPKQVPTKDEPEQAFPETIISESNE